MKEKVEINGATPLEDITLSRVTSAELLPHTPEIAAQMTGSEWLASLSGTGDEKKLLTVNCNWCHSYQQIFRNRYDEDGWGHIINRMTKGAGSPLINMRPRGRFNDADTARLVKWLATVRGPEAKDPAVRHAAAAAGTRRPASSSPNTSCRGSSSPPTTWPAIRRATSGTARIAAPISAGSIRSTGAVKEFRIPLRERRRASGHALDPRRQERHRLGLGELGPQHLSLRSEDRRLQAHPLEGDGAGEFAGGRQRRVRSGRLHLAHPRARRSPRSMP